MSEFLLDNPISKRVIVKYGEYNRGGKMNTTQQKFETLKMGDKLKYLGEIFMKTEEFKYSNVISLHNGACDWFCPDLIVNQLTDDHPLVTMIEGCVPFSELKHGDKFYVKGIAGLCVKVYREAHDSYDCGGGA